MKKNPLNDANYTGNDEQISDLKDLVTELLATLENIIEYAEAEAYALGDIADSKETEALAESAQNRCAEARAALAKAKGEQL